jgi:hypothetical protein
MEGEGEKEEERRKWKQKKKKEMPRIENKQSHMIDYVALLILFSGTHVHHVRDISKVLVFDYDICAPPSPYLSVWCMMCLVVCIVQ